MPYELTEHSFVIFTDGLDVVHGPIHNDTGRHTVSGQPFMVKADSEEALIDMFYETQVDDDGNPVLNDQEEPIRIWRDFKWSVGYLSEEQASNMCDAVKGASGGSITVQPIKHPERDEWCIPLQCTVLGTLPEGPARDAIMAYSAQQAADGNHKDRAQMTLEGWFV